MEIEEQKKILIDELRAIGVARLVIEYSGSGDSGGIDSVYAYTAEDVKKIDASGGGGYIAPSDVDELVKAYYGADGMLAIRVSDRLIGVGERPFSTKLENFAYELLDAHFCVGDWENDDGGSGTLTFYVEGHEAEGYPPGHIVCDHEQYETISHSASYEL